MTNPKYARQKAFRERQKEKMERMREALEFYGDPEAWNQPPVRITKGLFGDEYESKSSQVQRDRGARARQALSPQGKKCGVCNDTGRRMRNGVHDGVRCPCLKGKV